MMQKGIRPAFLIPACVLLVILLYYKAFLSPVLTGILSDAREISVLQASVSDVQSKSEEVEDLRKKLAGLESQILHKKAYLPDGLDPYEIILLLSKTDDTAIVKNSLIFLDPIEQEDFIILPVRIHFSADYNGLIKFLSFLDTLKVRPTVSNMQITAASAEENIRNAMDETGKVIYNLDVIMTLNFYMERDSYAS